MAHVANLVAVRRFDKVAWPCMVLMIFTAGFFTAQKLLELLL